jgi:hypothetical protein
MSTEKREKLSNEYVNQPPFDRESGQQQKRESKQSSSLGKPYVHETPVGTYDIT